MYDELLELLREYLPEEKVVMLAAMTTAFDSKDSVLFVIDGRQGPTGKTTLQDKLNSLGYKAVEQWERKYYKRPDKNPDKSTENSFEIVIRLNKFVR